MKRIFTFCILLFVFCIFLTACGTNECEHTYDNVCDATCNECGEARDVQATTQASLLTLSINTVGFT